MRREVRLGDEFGDPSGRKEPPSVATGWVRPDSVNLLPGNTEAESCLVYAYSEPLKTLKIKSGMVEEFIALAPEGGDLTIVRFYDSAPYDHSVAEKILSYSRRWGSLLGMRQDLDPGDPTSDFAGILTSMSEKESLNTWRAHARTAKAMLLVASDLEKFSRSNELNRRRLLTQLNQWLFSGTRPGLDWETGQYVIRLKARNLLGALAIQIAVMVARREGVGLCRSCGCLFFVKGHRKLYCEHCSRIGPLRDARRKVDSAKRQTRELWRGGRTASQIAKELGRKAKQIEAWIRELKEKGSKADQRRGLEKSRV